MRVEEIERIQRFKYLEGLFRTVNQIFDSKRIILGGNQKEKSFLKKFFDLSDFFAAIFMKSKIKIFPICLIKFLCFSGFLTINLDN